MSNKVILIMPDIQAPFHHPDTLPFLVKLRDKYKPTRVVNIGDLCDLYCLSNWIKSPEAISPKEEIKKMLDFTKQISTEFPVVDILTSNHDKRLLRAAERSQIPKHFLKSYNEWMGLPNTWKFHDELLIDSIMFTHGNEIGVGGSNAAIQRVLHYGRSCVCGHLHTMSEIRYFANREKLLFGMQVGCLIDRKAIAFEYERQNLKKPILSAGIIIDGIPMLIPMHLNNKGRWTKKF